MDPFLEDPAVWEEFHHVFITECMYQLGDRLPAGYVAKIAERTHSISIDDDAAREYVPDVAVARQRGTAGTPAKTGPLESGGGGGTATTLAPAATIPLIESTEVREGYVEIRRLGDHELVTVIEVLSPWNKFGEGVGIYREKRRALVQRGVHVVEIDLLIRGQRTQLARPLPPGHYYAMVFRADARPNVDVYAWRLADPLPSLPVPLRAPAAGVMIDLAGVFAAVYERARYDRKLDYGRTPKLPAEELAWVAGMLKRAGG
jgi:hypothetical protein